MTSTSEPEPAAALQFPIFRTCPFAPPEEYRRRRDQAAIVAGTMPNGDLVWAVTRFAEARQILADPRISSDTGRPGRPREGDDRPDEGFFVESDPPEHTRHRRVLITDFSARAVNAMRPSIQRIVDEVVDGVLAAGPPTDLMAAVARPVPVRIMCELLGVPRADWATFEAWMLALALTIMDPQAPRASREVRGYLREMVLRGQREPVAGLMGRLAAKHLPSGELSVDGLVNIGFLLLLTGYELQANMITLGVLTLLEHPDQLAALRADPGLMPGAIDELMRFHSLQDWQSFERVAAADLEVAGVRIRAGDRVTVLAASANRDERAFTDPDAFDIGRDARHHLAFGHGIHQCLGGNLSRTELEIVYSTLLSRLPGLRLAAPFDELSLATGTPFFGLRTLPLTW